MGDQWEFHVIQNVSIYTVQTYREFSFLFLKRRGRSKKAHSECKHGLWQIHLNLTRSFSINPLLVNVCPTLKKKNLYFVVSHTKNILFFPTGLPKTKCNRLISVPLPPPPPPQRLMKFSDIAFWLIALLSCPSLLDKSEYSFYEGNGPVRSPITPVPIVNNLQVI